VLVRDAPLFAAAPGSALDALEASRSERTVAAGEWLFREGDLPDALYVVVSGRLRVTAHIGDEEETIRVVGPGSLLGELGVLTGAARSASVQAVRDSQVVALDAARFLELVRTDAAFAAALAEELARQLQRSGGLLPSAARAAVFTVVGAGASSVAERVRTQLAAEFAAIGPTETLDGPESTPSSAADLTSLVGRAEARSSYVLLFADGRGDATWDEFALRQSDRVLLVTDGSTQRWFASEKLHGADVIFVGSPSPAQIARCLDEVGARNHYIVQAGDADGVARVARRLTGRALGVVLSGGGARGLAHIGALHALHDAGFELDRIGGCSIGSFIGAMAAFGWSAEHMIGVCEAELVRRAPFSDYTIPRVSLIRARRAAAMLERVFGATHLEELARPLFAVSADLLASEVIVHRRGPVFEAVGASMSIPGLAPPVSSGSRLLVDGGVLNNLPVDLMDASEGPVVAIDVIRRMRPAEEEQAVSRLPSIMETLSRATVLGSAERAERNRRLAALTITPDVQDMGLREFSKLEEAVDAGRKAADEALAAGGEKDLRAALGV
jgi:NTE family protein